MNISEKIFVDSFIAFCNNEMQRVSTRTEEFKLNLLTVAKMLSLLQQERRIEIVSSKLENEVLIVSFKDPACNNFVFTLRTTNNDGNFGFAIYYIFGSVYYKFNDENLIEKYKENINEVPKKFWSKD